MTEASERAAKLLSDLKKIGEFDVHGPFLRELAEILVLLATESAWGERFAALVEKMEGLERVRGEVPNLAERVSQIDAFLEPLGRERMKSAARKRRPPEVEG